jgi:hypothetical protein
MLFDVVLINCGIINIAILKKNVSTNISMCRKEQVVADLETDCNKLPTCCVGTAFSKFLEQVLNKVLKTCSKLGGTTRLVTSTP